MVNLKSLFNTAPEEPVASDPVYRLSGVVERCALFYTSPESFGLSILLVGANQPIRLKGSLFTAGNYNELTQPGDEISIGIDANEFFCLDTFENLTLKNRLGIQ